MSRLGLVLLLTILLTLSETASAFEWWPWRDAKCGTGEKQLRKGDPCMSAYLVEYLYCVQNTDKSLTVEYVKADRKANGNVRVGVKATTPSKRVPVAAEIDASAGAALDQMNLLARMYNPERGGVCEKLATLKQNADQGTTGAPAPPPKPSAPALGVSAPVAPAPRPCSNGAFPDGECLPPPGSVNLPETTMYKLYDRCVKQGRDEYTPNCCDHLSLKLARTYKVCGQS